MSKQDEAVVAAARAVWEEKQAEIDKLGRELVGWLLERNSNGVVIMAALGAVSGAVAHACFKKGGARAGALASMAIIARESMHRLERK